MAAHCLDRLEILREWGVNEEVIKNTTGLVYLGELRIYRTHLDLTQPQSLAMADTVRICELF